MRPPLLHRCCSCLVQPLATTTMGAVASHSTIVVASNPPTSFQQATAAAGSNLDLQPHRRCPLHATTTIVSMGATIAGRHPSPSRHFAPSIVRAGESEFESIGVINTNPTAKTSMDSGLSEQGKKRTLKAALSLKAMEACDDRSAEIVASVNGLFNSRSEEGGLSEEAVGTTSCQT